MPQDQNRCAAPRSGRGRRGRRCARRRSRWPSSPRRRRPGRRSRPRRDRRGVPIACWTDENPPSRTREPGQPVGVVEQRRTQAGEGVEALLDEQLERAAERRRADELGVAAGCARATGRRRRAGPRRCAGRAGRPRSTSVIGEPGGTRYVHSISQYAAVKAMCSARAGSAPMLPMSHASLTASSARSPGDRYGVSSTSTPSRRASSRAMSGETPVGDAVVVAAGDEQEVAEVDRRRAARRSGRGRRRRRESGRPAARARSLRPPPSVDPGDGERYRRRCDGCGDARRSGRHPRDARAHAAEHQRGRARRRSAPPRRPDPRCASRPTMREAIATAGDAEVIFGFIPQAAVRGRAEAALGALHRVGHGHVPVPGHAGERRRADR